MGGKTSKESEIHDNRELNRRNAVNKTKIMFKILFNGKEVCQSQSKIIGQDFVVPIGQIFPIQIQQWPESLRIQIIEGSTLKSSVIADVQIPVCDPNTSLDKVSYIPIWLRNRFVSAGFLSQIKELCIASYHSRFSTNIKIKSLIKVLLTLVANKNRFNKIFSY